MAQPYDFRQVLRGLVTSEEVSNNRAVYRFVQKYLTRWLEKNRPDVKRESSYFDVTFTREGKGHEIACQLRLRLDQEQLTGVHYGENISEALRLALEHMTRSMHPINVLSAHNHPRARPRATHS